jgi:hypothetical protein
MTDSTTNNSSENQEGSQPTGQPGQDESQVPEAQNESTQEDQSQNQLEPAQEQRSETQDASAQEDQIQNQSEPVKQQQPENQEAPAQGSQPPGSNEPVAENKPPSMPPEESDSRRTRRRRRGSIFFPLLLIVVGAALLLSNLGFVSTSVWGTLISLWPVILIAWGLDSIWRGEGITGAVFLLGLGVVFLLGNFGYLQLNPWQVLFTIWPVLLVAIGIDILIGRRRNAWTTLLGVILVVVLMVGALWLAGVGSPAGVAVSGERVEFGLQGANSANIQILPSSGNLVLDTMNTPDILLTGTVPQSTSNQNITQEFMKSGDIANLTLRSSGFQIYYSPGQTIQSVWDLSFTELVPVFLTVNLGAGEASLDLTNAQVSDLRYNLGVGTTTITVPQSGVVTIAVDQAIGQVTIIVPAGTALQLTSNTGLTNRNLPEGFQQINNRIFQSPGYGNSENKVNLDVNLAIGQVTVQQK